MGLYQSLYSELGKARLKRPADLAVKGGIVLGCGNDNAVCALRLVDLSRERRVVDIADPLADARVAIDQQVGRDDANDLPRGRASVDLEYEPVAKRKAGLAFQEIYIDDDRVGILRRKPAPLNQSRPQQRTVGQYAIDRVAIG